MGGSDSKLSDPTAAVNWTAQAVAAERAAVQGPVHPSQIDVKVTDVSPRTWFGIGPPGVYPASATVQRGQEQLLGEGKTWGSTQGGQSAWAQYRAGEQGGPGMQSDPRDPMGELQMAPTSGYASGSPESTQGGQTVAPSGAEGGGTDWSGMLKKFGAALGSQKGGGLSNYQPSPSPMAAIPQHDITMGRYMLTPYQNHILGQMGLQGESAQRFLSNQIMSGNPQFGPYSAQQIQAAQRMFGRG